MAEQGQPAQTPAVAATPQSPAATGLEHLSYAELRGRLNELQQQRQTIANRRENLSGQYERATGANQNGIGNRLTIMDNSIVGLEGDIAAVAKQMAVKAPAASTQPPPGGPDIYTEEDVAGVGFMVFLSTALITIFVMRRIARRRWNRMQPANAPGAVQSNERLDRIEQAVDSIAVEIERVSENQRFMTRLMTETQLAGTIAAVRSSAEAAKSAADPARP